MRLHPVLRVLCGVVLGAAISVPLVSLVTRARGAQAPTWRLVPEDASGPLHRIAIHYAPALDGRALPVWRTLFAALPPEVEVEVAVAEARDFERFVTSLRSAGVQHIERFHPVPVHHELTTWSRDRMAALVGPHGEGAVLAPPRVETPTASRAGDWYAPFALARETYAADAHVAGFVFEGGDLAASRRHVFADANLIGRNLGRGDATRAHLEAALRATFAQDIVWLGDAPGEVPEHHVMMYLVPLDDDTVAVGDVELGRTLLAGEPAGADLPVDPDLGAHAARFDRAAELAAARGLRVVRFPVVVLAGGGSYVTYTNALFDRDAAGPVVYLPTYRLPALDGWARGAYEGMGYRVVEIDVSTIYQLNGSLGCLVNVMARR